MSIQTILEEAVMRVIVTPGVSKDDALALVTMLSFVCGLGDEVGPEKAEHLWKKATLQVFESVKKGVEERLQ